MIDLRLHWRTAVELLSAMLDLHHNLNKIMALYTSDWAGLIRLIGKESWLLAAEVEGWLLAVEVEEHSPAEVEGDQSLGRVGEHNPAEVVEQSLGEGAHLLQLAHSLAGLPSC